jgi:hypothetical protein
MPILTIALDRDSVRRTDQYGRLHVAVSHLTKATVNPYKGSEIPSYQRLDLDPGRVYQLLRDPAELQKAVPSFNNIPILDRHVPVTAADSKRERVVGSTGTDAAWHDPYIDNSLVFWDEQAIADVENGTLRELSAAYGYDPDMTPGIWKGLRYDGVMRNIRANHVAQVEAGRAGSDVMVMDSALDLNAKGQTMQTRTVPLSPRAMLIKGAATAWIGANLAQDQQMPDLNPILIGTTAKNYADKKDTIGAAIRRLTMGKLAEDADITDLHKLLDGFSKPGEPPPEEASSPVPPSPPVRDDEPRALEGELDPQGTNAASMAAEDDDLEQKIREVLEGKIDPDDLEMVLKLIRPEEAMEAPPDNGGGEGAPPPGDRRGARDNRGAADQPPPTAGTPPPPVPGNGGGIDRGRRGGARDNRAAKDANPKIDPGEQPVPSTGAMDRAIRANAIVMDRRMQAAIEAERERGRIVRDTSEFVRPWIGNQAMAMDSAEDILRLALETHGVEAPPTADIASLRALLNLVPKPGERPRAGGNSRLAQDSKTAVAGTYGRFPELKGARVIG